MPAEFPFDDLDLNEQAARGDSTFPEGVPLSDNPQCCSLGGRVKRG
jgi:hypothetical protein